MRQQRERSTRHRFSLQHVQSCVVPAHRREAGFTLVELLVVIVILGILSAVVVFAVQGVGDKGKTAAIDIDERIVRTAEEAYCAQHGKYVDGQTLVSEGYLTELPEYHEVTASNTPPTGPCNGWRYEITETPAAGPTSTPPTTTPLVEDWVPLGGGPSARYGATMAEYPKLHNLVLFGGKGAGVTGSGAVSFGADLGDTWTWAAGTWAPVVPSPLVGCEQEPPQSLTPCPRAGHAMAFDGDKVILVGGVFSYHPAGEQQNVVSREYRDTWSWDGTTWTRIDTPQTPGPQSVYGTMAYDAKRDQVVLFGGYVVRGPGRNVATNDMWIWSRSTQTWTAFYGPRPSARRGASMAYDPVSERLILFGGEFGDTGQEHTDRLFGDTWAWDGSTWSDVTPRPPSPSPVPRRFAPMTSDYKSRIVLFGGQDDVPRSDDSVVSLNPSGLPSDTWTWAGSSWTKREPPHSPPGRSLAAFAYQSEAEVFVMFGGDNLPSASPETWAYRTIATPSTPP